MSSATFVAYVLPGPQTSSADCAEDNQPAEEAAIMNKPSDSTMEDDISGISLKRLRLETRILILWAKGASTRQIAQETGQPVNLIYALLKSQERAIFEEEGVIYHGKKNDT